MKQSVNPAVFFSVIGVLVVVGVVLAIWVFNRPSSVADTSEGAKGSAIAAGKADPRAEHGGPNTDQKQQIEEWKKTHPNATTRY